MLCTWKKLDELGSVAVDIPPAAAVKRSLSTFKASRTMG